MGASSSVGVRRPVSDRVANRTPCQLLGPLRVINARLRRVVEDQLKGETIRVRGMEWSVRPHQQEHVRFRLHHGEYRLLALSTLYSVTKGEAFSGT